jgi:hypothetical protein
MSSSASDRIYSLQGVSGKGKGLVAIKKIFKGTRILSEEPIITIPGNKLNIEQLQIYIYRQVATLSKHQQRAFLSMHNIHPYKDAAEQYLGIVRTNSLPAEADGDKGAIFVEACRINHACDNNAQKSWNEKIKRHTVHALRDIDKGEEITITYLGPLKNRTARQKALQERFGFTCLCHLCSLPPEQSQDSDRRLEEIHRLDGVIDQLGREGILVSPLRTLSYFDQQVRLYNEQGREDVGFAQALVNAAQLAIANSDLARGRIFAERAASVWKTTLGGDSTEAIKHGALAQVPSKYELCGMSMKWKTKVDEALQGLEPSDFEDWLWRREKPKQPGQPVDFRNQATFRGFNDLPHENHIGPEFYKLFSVQPVQDKGKGLVACVNIDKGKRILSEKPLFTTSNWSSMSLMESGIAAKLKALSKTEQRQCLSLHNNFPGKHPFSGIVKTNALPCGPDSMIGGVYPTICLINHSCLPNAHNSWNSDTDYETIHAIRFIKEGEKITISYDKGGSSSSRRAYLKNAFGFDCNCSLCILPPADLQASDARRRQIQLLDNAIGDPERRMKKPEESLADCHSLLQILDEEYKGSAGALIPRLYYDAFQISISHGDQARASAFAERGFKSRVICEGEDSPETQRIKSLKENPAGHGSFGASNRWKTSKRSIPTGLDNSGFETWLWRERA